MAEKKIDPTSPAKVKLRGASKKKWEKLLAEKTPENHAQVMRKLGITPKEDRQWHKIHGGEPADFDR